MRNEVYLAIFASLVLVFVAWVVYSPTGNVVLDVEDVGYMNVLSSEAFMIIEENSGIIIIDVSPNYMDGHLPNAINYYVGDGSLDAAIPMLDSSAMYLVYCHFDGASRAGAQKLVDAGFTNVYRLSDHYGGWVNMGYPVEY